MAEEYRLTREVNYGSDAGNRYIGEGVHSVSDEDVEEIEESRLWEAVEDDGETEDGGEEDAPDDEGEEAEEDGDASEDEGEAFDAEAFIDRNWRSVVAEIEDGDADDALDEVEQEEQDRDSPRDSVLEAIEGRR
jgi:hypothetical protein